MVHDAAAWYFWGFLAVYGLVMVVLSPRARSFQSFFRGADAQGNPVAPWSLTASIFISWIFAKSVTNAANLGDAYGIVGGLAYATYWLSIPVAGVVIYRLRTRSGATSLTGFLIGKYGRLAAVGFSIAILIRLYNEVWSNTAVVAGYFGQPGQPVYYTAAIAFTLVTLLYSLKGGLRSSIFTDVIQAAVFVVFLGAVLLVIFPLQAPARLITTGAFRLDSGVDLLLVALLQVLSYPFHDPVLTDRGFINDEKKMLRAFVVAGLLGFVCILAFSLVGIHARLAGLTVLDNAPVAVGRSLGLGALFMMSVVMISSAGSTLDSTFASLSKSAALDIPALLGRGRRPSVRLGMWVMIAFAVLGNLPLFAGAEILKATTVSGTMVMGLAPVFLLAGLIDYSPASFHLSFWPGVLMGILLAAGLIPAAWAIGDGKYAMLLGTNLWGLVICSSGFMLPLLVHSLTRNTAAEGSPP
jgi:SSS family solute:Na+ symporter